MDVFSNRKKNLQRILRDRFSGVAARLADVLGKNPSYLSRQIDDDSVQPKRIGEKLARDYEKKLGMTPLSLDIDPAAAERTGQMFDGGDAAEDLGDEITRELELLAMRERLSLRVPIVGHTQGGPDVEWVELGYPTGWGDEFFELLCPDPNAYGLIVRGESMHPKFSEGEAVCVAPNMDPAPGDFVILKRTDGTVMLKQFTSHANRRYVFESINNGHGRLVVNEDEIEFMHYVYAGLPMSAIRHV